ncbi:hypothetical protein MKK55_13030 [Methylobacterium sp. J-059]|uniref:hypothetical protein n=1 Tax=Methylobacterium sp. J-059 TaxID=2836643 RepID=UPI001FB9B18D|nr:hypothetical protein [Methylobacterium sp. J-059]MCJ2039853.1 hypothetical protein [Methylobacterium sp. J-059]
MFEKVRSIVAKQSRPAEALADDRPAMPIEELMGSFPPMKPVRPPAAINDDVMAPVYEVVEEELRQAGLLDRRHG